MSSERRKYTKRRRAQSEQRTRQRITEAAVALHQTVGPARATISAIADKASVQRATVYRHFPDEESLFAACSGHFRETNPPPDPAALSDVSDPTLRLERALTDTYGYYGRTEAMLEKVFRDAPLVKAMAKPVAARRAHFDAFLEAAVAGRPERGRARRRVKAAVAHALSFPTWRSLVREQGLEDDEAVALMAAMVEAAGRARR
jgi:AcrR family transcriptional regulator